MIVVSSIQDYLSHTLIKAIARETHDLGLNIDGIPDIFNHKQNGYLDLCKGIINIRTGLIIKKYQVYETNFDSFKEIGIIAF